MKKERKNTTTRAAVSKKGAIKRNSLLSLGFGLLIIILVNILGNYVHTRFDLTTEKRYTLSPATKDFLRNIDDVVYFQVYLEGDFPAEFKRLRNATREMLDEFRAYNDKVQYKFINPGEGKDAKAYKAIAEQLKEKGLDPVRINESSTEGMSQKIVFPGAIVSYKGKEMPLTLLSSQQGRSTEQALNNSIQSLEYNITNVIRKLSVKVKPRIAFIQGHGELDQARLADIYYALSEYYQVDFVKIDGKLNSLAIRDTIHNCWVNKYRALIIAKPDSIFSDKDNYMIDQHIMRGGKTLWFVDPVFASMDSLQAHNETMGYAPDLRLAPLLFFYGVRLNTNLVLDVNCANIPVVTGEYNGQPQQEFFPWYYFPVVTPTANHPIVKNLDAIRCEFVSSIDTVGKGDIKKTVLLSTSRYSKTLNTPTRISLDIMMEKPDDRFFNKHEQPIAVLLTGKFKSVFRDNLSPDITQDKAKYDFRAESPENAMIVVSDGDIIANQLHYSKGYPLPLGYDQFTNQWYGNKDFVMNAVDFLCDSSGLISVRSRELKLRLLDKNKIAKNRVSIQILNTVLPVGIVLVFGIVWMIVRRRIFAGKGVSWKESFLHIFRNFRRKKN